MASRMNTALQNDNKDEQSATREAFAGRLSVLRPFDPWASRLCTCPPKLSLNPYNGCGNECFYCYVSSYSRWWGGDRVVPKQDLERKLARDIEKIAMADDPALSKWRGGFVSIANSSDPYPQAPAPNEAELRLTRRCLSMLSESGFRILLVTKSDLVIRDLDILDPARTVIAITVTTDRDDLAARMEPYAPSPLARLAALRECAGQGFATVCRVDPIILGLNDEASDLERLMERLADAGVPHIISSTLKLRLDSARRLQSKFPEIYARLWPRYQRSPRRDNYWYLPEGDRRGCLEVVSELAQRQGMTFAVCREGLTDLNTALCDGREITQAETRR